MFKHSEVREPRRPLSFWLKIGAAVVVVMLAINFIRVNREPSPEGSAVQIARLYTEKGPLVSGIVEIPEGDFISYRVELPHRFTITGRFRRLNQTDRIAFFILSEENFHRWKNGEEFQFATATGKVPAGDMTRALEAGTYYIVFDNREPPKTRVVYDVELEIR